MESESPLFRPTDLVDMIGQMFMIDPRRLLNKKRLFATQDWIDMNKLTNALQGLPDLEEEPPRGWVFLNERSQICYVLGDGHHRTGIAWLRNESTPFTVIGIWQGDRVKYGFNAITKRIRNEVARNFDPNY